MKNLRKIAGYIFPHENGGIPLALLALAATASSCGVVAIWLWVAHSPPAPSPADATRRNCLERCNKVCGGLAP
jgi:hypothetical protein